MLDDVKRQEFRSLRNGIDMFYDPRLEIFSLTTEVVRPGNTYRLFKNE